jgi:hypothetical protein
MASGGIDSGRWAKLRTWIAENEDYEQTHGHPRPLNENQAAALQLLLAHVDLRDQDAVPSFTPVALPPRPPSQGEALPGPHSSSVIDEGKNYIGSLSGLLSLFTFLIQSPASFPFLPSRSIDTDMSAHIGLTCHTPGCK